MIARGLLARRQSAAAKPTEARAAPLSDSWWRSLSFGGVETFAGPQVNEDSALALSVVYACVRVRERTVGRMPLHIYRREGSSRHRLTAREHPLSRILGQQFNAHCSAYEGKEFLERSLALRGNAVAQIQRNRRGEVMALYPLRWDRIRVDIVAGARTYIYSPAPGERERVFPASEIWHPMTGSRDGVVGMSPIAVQREAIGLGLAMAEHGSALFRRGAMQAGILTIPGALGGTNDERVASSLRIAEQVKGALGGGRQNSHKIAVMEEGMKWDQMGINPKDAEFLQGRKFNRAEIAGWMSVPIHLVGDTERGDFSVDTLSREWIQVHLAPEFEMLEQRGYVDLLTEREQEDLELAFDVNAVLRGDPTARAAYYQSGIAAGWMVRNEARTGEGLNPIPGLDEPLAPLNMALVDENGAPVQQAGPMPGGPTQGARSETRAADDAVERRARAAERFIPLVEGLVRQIVAAEAREVRKILDAQERRTPDAEGLARALEAFHAEQGEFRSFMVLRGEPVFAALGASLFDLAAEEIPEETNRDGLNEFLKGLAIAFAARYAVSSRNQLVGAAELAGQAGEDGIGAARIALDGFVATRPARVARRETVQQARRSAVEAFRRSGARNLRWVTRGAENCPFCQSRSGMVIPIDGGHFLAADESIEAEGRPPLKAKRAIAHPPLHRGCDCEIAAA